MTMDHISSHKFIVRGSCPDQAGIVSRITTCLYENGLNIEEAAQFNDQPSGYFFFRIVCSCTSPTLCPNFRPDFERVATSLAMDWGIYPLEQKTRTLLMVSKSDHCLNDILYRWQNKLLPIDITAVISNHETHRAQVEAKGLPFLYLPVSAENRAAQELAIQNVIADTASELIVLARYMQVLSDDMSRMYHGRIINIHHSFLPGFKGAKPYHQAYDRGVKMIGATAHFVTSDLDEGPIIEQDIARITHAHTPEKLQIIGQDIESRVLASAILAYAERRVFLNGHRTAIL